ncbi:hypothetical protein JCM16358_01110 [Halanaerocella petrolearia]
MAKISCIVDSCVNNAGGECKLEEIKVTANDNGQFSRRAQATKCQSFIRE